MFLAPSAAPPTPTPVPTPAQVSDVAAGATATEILDFVAALVGSLAWPLTVLTLLLVFGKALRGLLNSLKARMPSIERLKTPWGEAIWSETAVQEVAGEVGTTLPEPPTEPSGTPGESDDIAIALARLKPSAGVIDAFTDVERQLVRYVSALNLPLKASPVHVFARDPRAPSHLKNGVYELSQLRNAAAHGRGDISEASAVTYILTARRVANEIKMLADGAERGGTEWPGLDGEDQ